MARKPELTRLSLSSSRLDGKVRVLILTDLHEQVRQAWIEAISALEADMAVIAGDCLEAHSRNGRKRELTLALVRALAGKMPVFCSLGNHELGTRGNRLPIGHTEQARCLPPVARELSRLLSEAGATVLHNACVRHGALCIGGLTSAGGEAVDAAVLSSMAEESGFRLLLCHHPEYYGRYVAAHNIDLTVSGHAHGGQWRLFGQGLYAPGQGLFPRLTSGFYEQKRLLVSRGLGGRFPVPRVGNRPQIILLTLLPEQ